MKEENSLCLFVKAPISGYVKTRLIGDLESGEAVDLYTAMVHDIINQIDDCGYDLWIFYSPENEFQRIQSWLGRSFSYHVQTGIDLGDRMARAFRWCFEKGYKKSLIIGGDMPTITGADIEDAFLALDDYDAVFGPVADGGYYLIGLKEPRNRLFENIFWGSDSVLKMSMNVMNESGLTFCLLQEKYDIDTYDDFIRLSKDPAFQRLNHTKHFLDQLLNKKNS